MINDAFDKNWEVGAETAYNEFGDEEQNSFGLSYSHAYIVLGTEQLKDEEGIVQENLIIVHNPWRFEGYTGPWSDEDDRWTDNYKK